MSPQLPTGQVQLPVGLASCEGLENPCLLKAELLAVPWEPAGLANPGADQFSGSGGGRSQTGQEEGPVRGPFPGGRLHREARVPCGLAGGASEDVG